MDTIEPNPDLVLPAASPEVIPVPGAPSDPNPDFDPVDDPVDGEMPTPEVILQQLKECGVWSDCDLMNDGNAEANPTIKCQLSDERHASIYLALENNADGEGSVSIDSTRLFTGEPDFFWSTAHFCDYVGAYEESRLSLIEFVSESGNFKELSYLSFQLDKPNYLTRSVDDKPFDYDTVCPEVNGQHTYVGRDSQGRYNRYWNLDIHIGPDGKHAFVAARGILQAETNTSPQKDGERLYQRFRANHPAGVEAQLREFLDNRMELETCP
jgi:hypothetical protein